MMKCERRYYAGKSKAHTPIFRMKKCLERKIFLGFDYLHKYIWSCVGFMCMYKFEIIYTKRWTVESFITAHEFMKVSFIIYFQC